jgi:hypothetical protein
VCCFKGQTAVLLSPVWSDIHTMELKTRKRAFKIPAKLYRIGEVVRHSPFSRQTIHNYTIMGLIREAKWTEGGHRLYDESVFERLAKITDLKKSKTLLEIRQILSREEASGGIAKARCQSEQN